MPRFPTRDEARAIGEHRLGDVWGDIGSAEDVQSFFTDIGTITGAELSLATRIRIAEAMLAFSTDIRLMLGAEAFVKAQRLVTGLRRETTDLQRGLAKFELQWTGAAEAVRLKVRLQAAREFGAIYLNARQHQSQFESLSGDAAGMPNKRLAEIGDAVWGAMWKIGPPFRFADCDGALSRLDTVLENWAQLTGAQKGRSPESKALSDMIMRFLEVFEDATGRSASAPRSRFRSFVKRILRALPRDKHNANGIDSGALPKRIRRITGDR